MSWRSGGLRWKHATRTLGSPVGREKHVSQALQAHAALTTSDYRGAVRDLSQLKR